MDIRRYSLEVLVCLFVTDIAGAQNLLNFAGNEKFLELCRKVVRSMGDMQVTNDKNKNHRKIQEKARVGIWLKFEMRLVIS